MDANDERDPCSLSDRGLDGYGLREAGVYDQHGLDLHESRVSEPSGSTGHGLCGVDVNDRNGRGLPQKHVSEQSGHDHRESVRGGHGQKR